MPKFESPLGSRTINNPNMREISIPDGNNPIIDQQNMMDFASRLQNETSQLSLEEQTKIEREQKERREAQRTGKEKPSNSGRTRVEMLIEMLRQHRETEIGGEMYVLQSLKSKEIREATTAAVSYDGTVEFSFELRKQILARSLVKVAGIDINEFLSSRDLETKLVFVEELDHSFLTRLYQEYLTLSNEVSEKYSLKTEEDVKEVMEDLKK